MKARHVVALTSYALLIVNRPAIASSDWDQFFAQVTQNCIAASSITRPRPSEIINVGTDDQHVAMLILDRSKGSNRVALCIYNKRTRTAMISAADFWSAPFQSNT